METLVSTEEGKETEKAADLNEGDTSVAELLEDGGLGGVSGRRITDEDGGGVSLPGAGGDDVPTDVARPANHQQPAPLLLPRRERHARGRRARYQEAN
jgi:hypothetical protein